MSVSAESIAYAGITTSDEDGGTGCLGNCWTFSLSWFHNKNVLIELKLDAHDLIFLNQKKIRRGMVTQRVDDTFPKRELLRWLGLRYLLCCVGVGVSACVFSSVLSPDYRYQLSIIKNYCYLKSSAEASN